MNTENEKKRAIKNMQCVLCQADFQAWLENLNLPEERKEKISKHFLEYCPVCTKKPKN
jgi:hypothetical protein